MIKKIYLIPGMGSYGLVFQQLDFKGLETQSLEHLEPNKRESLSNYAKRMAEQIPADEEPVILGLSMGGIIAQEIASHRKVKRIILLSSILSGEKWIPPFSIISKSRITRFVPNKAIKSIILFGIKHQGVPEKWRAQLFEMLKSYSPNYYGFASRELLTWKGCDYDTPVFRIHGTKDILFPRKHDDVDYAFNGGHFLIQTHASTVSEAILEICLKK